MKNLHSESWHFDVYSRFSAHTYNKHHVSLNIRPPSGSCGWWDSKQTIWRRGWCSPGESLAAQLAASTTVSLSTNSSSARRSHDQSPNTARMASMETESYIGSSRFSFLASDAIIISPELAFRASVSNSQVIKARFIHAAHYCGIMGT